jgi:tetratricopeptide (TPR) repeat protein
MKPTKPEVFHQHRAGPGGRALPWILAALVVLNLIVFAQVRDHEFVTWDDGPYVTENAHVKAGFTWPGLVWAWTAPTAPYWHPLTWMSHMADVELFGLDAGGHHLTSLAIHILNTLLLCALLAGMTGAVWRSAFVAALFAVHPLHVESVAWVAERKDVLSTFFLLLTLFAYVTYARRRTIGGYLAVVLSLALGLAAKPMLVTLPVLLLLLDIWPLGRWWQESRARLLLEKTPLFALAIAASVATYLIQQQVGAMAGFERLPLAHRIANAVVSYAGYIDKTFWPSGLAAFYPYPRDMPAGWMLGLSIVLLSAVSAAAIASLKRRPYVFVGWFWYVVTLVPVIGLIQVGDQAMADRFTYVSLIGLFVLLAWLVPDLFERAAYSRRVLAVAGISLIAAATAVAHGQVAHWRNSHALWERALDVTRDNYYAHSALGAILADEGRVNEAIAHQVEALRIKPNDFEAHNEFGKILAEQGNLTEAIRHFRAALRGNDGFVQAHHNLGMALFHQGSFAEAIAELAAALRLDPGEARSHDALGRALARSGDPGAAVPHFRDAIRLAPDAVESRYNLALALAEQHDLDAAIAEYRNVIHKAPGLAEARNNLALALDTQGHTAEAIATLDEALRLWPGRADLHYNLALIHYRRGARAEAVAHLETALAIDPRNASARRLLDDLRR